MCLASTRIVCAVLISIPTAERHDILLAPSEWILLQAILVTNTFTLSVTVLRAIIVSHMQTLLESGIFGNKAFSFLKYLV